IEAFGEPVVGRGKKIAGFLSSAPSLPQPSHANGRPKLPGFCLLGLRDCERALETCSRLRPTQLRQLQRDFALYAIDFCLVPPFLCCFYRGHRFANAAPSVVKLAEFRMGPGQM